MTRQFNWYWANVVIDDEYNEVAMISPNKEMIIFPFLFIRACIDKQCICTILLAFNMLMDRKIEKKEPGAYENILMNIHHLIPPYGFEGDG